MISLRPIPKTRKILINKLLVNERLKAYHKKLKRFLGFYLWTIIALIVSVSCLIYLIATNKYISKDDSFNVTIRIIIAVISALSIAIHFIVLFLWKKEPLFLITAYLWKRTNYKRYKFYFILIISSFYMIFISRWPIFRPNYLRLAKAIDTYIDYDRLKHLSMLDEDNNEKSKII